MTAFEHETNKVRLELILQKEIMPGIEFLAGPQPKSFFEFLIGNCKLIKQSKDQYLEESNSFEDGKLFYLYKGIARSYHYTSFNNKQNISRIWTKGDVIFDLNSFQNETNRDESIQMLEEGELLYISYSNLKTLLELFPNTMVLLLWIQIERELHYKFYQTLLKLSVEERVKIFLDSHPGIMSRINNDYIALYLGINRSSLSTAYKSYKQAIDEASS